MVPRLVRLIRARKPQLIQTWMYHSDLAGGIAARFAGSPPVVWGIHHTVAERKALKPATYLVARLNALLSRRLPAKIVCCAESARLSHTRLGYFAKKMTVIPNGFDPDVFQPDASARAAVRQELGLTSETLLVGQCARFHPEKDHRTFLRAAQLVHHEIPEVHFLLWGKGMETGNEMLANWNREEGPGACVHFLGQRSDSNRLFAALDLATLSSFTEAFPAVIGEAMACAVPCVATDAGDTRIIIGDTGRIVPKRDPESLAQAMLAMLSQPAERRILGERARQRIIQHYSLEKMAGEYAGLYRDIITGG
jgi:glycosyltransferase involved in cell wall biosynthesis